MLELRNQVILLFVLICLVLASALVIFQWRPFGPTPPSGQMGGAATLPATFTPRSACTECHEPQQKLWHGSHHDLAMQPANEQTVLGDFNNTTFTHFGVTSEFYIRDEGFYVTTDGPDGVMREYKIEYTFGVTPLQQYLIKFPGGRYQVLGICWDSRPEEQGGQRWYHLYTDEPIPHDDELHWTGPNQNWNFMCAECHSTNLQKRYDLNTDTYNTTWTEIDVSCQACHGPGSNHVRWAKDYERGIDRGDPTMGLTLNMKNNDGVWQFEPGAVTAQRSKPIENQTMLQMCARCHSRRSVIAEHYHYGSDLSDTHNPELLSESFYFADGQIQDEVYVYGSFIQSKMYEKGVTCTDCHDPHSMRVYSPGNSLCSKCHLPEAFDTPDHHFHEQDTESSQCVACHMPTRTYMGVDERLDHSIRVPRPDLSVKLGTPNACNKCHDDQTHEWAAQAVADWYGPERRNEPHFGEALHAGRTRTPNAIDQLANLAADVTQPGIARATAIVELLNYPSQRSFEAILSQSRDNDPLIRRAVASSLQMLEPNLRLPVAMEMLNDPVLSVRLEAARVLAPADTEELEAADRQMIEQSFDAYVQSQMVNADRPESHLNIALLELQRDRTAGAEASYRTAIRINPKFAQAYVNLADMYRSAGQDHKAAQVLQNAIENGIRQGVIHYALGLTLVRQGQTDAAIRAFEKAFETSPQDPQFGYTLGIALNSTGRPARAVQMLEKNLAEHPTDEATLIALMTINRDRGHKDDALKHAKRLLELNPANADGVRAFIRELSAQPTFDSSPTPNN